MLISDWSSDGCSSDLIEDITAKVGKLDIAAAEKARLVDAAKAAWSASAGPAYTRLLAEMKRQQPGAPTADGVWRLDRKRVVSGKSVSVRVDIGGRRSL